MPKAVRVATIARLIELRSQGKQLSNYRHTRQQFHLSIISALISIILGFAGTVSAFWFRLPNGSSPFKVVN